LTRRFDIGPFVLALAALVLLVALFLDWFATFNAWQVFEIVDVVLAALAVAAVVAAVGLVVPTVDYVDRRFVPWIVGAAFVLVADQVLQPPAGLDSDDLGIGAWLAFGATIFMVIGALLSLSKVSIAVGVEGRDRRRRVSAVDHRPPPTESGEPVQRSSLLDDPPGSADAGGR
jgi:hypothetical protein